MATLIQVKRGLNANRLGLTPLNGELIFTTDTNELFVGDGVTLGGLSLNSSLSLSTTNNLSDLNDSIAARTNLGLGTVAVLNVGSGAGDVSTNADIDSKINVAVSKNSVSSTTSIENAFLYG